jgi:hypothetical protein
MKIIDGGTYKRTDLLEQIKSDGYIFEFKCKTGEMFRKGEECWFIYSTDTEFESFRNKAKHWVRLEKPDIKVLILEEKYE